MDAFLLFIEDILKKIVFACMSLLLIIIFCTVITRYCFAYTPSFSEELSRYLFVWSVFLSLPIVARSGSNMAIEMLTNRLKGKALLSVQLCSATLTATFLLIMIYQGALLAVSVSYQTSPALDLSMAYVYVAIPIGCSIMLLNVAAGFVKTLRSLTENSKQE